MTLETAFAVPRPERRRGAGPVAAATVAPAMAAPERIRLPRPVLIYLVLVLVPVQFHAGPLYMTGPRLFLLIMIVPLLIGLVTGRMGRIILTDILFILHILWMLVALAVNNPAVVVQNFGSAGIDFLGGYLLARAFIRNREQFIALCRALGVMVCLLVPLAIHETLTGNPLLVQFFHRLPFFYSYDIVRIDRRMGLERVQGVFSHPIHFGLFCSTAFSLVLVGLKPVLPTLQRLAMAAAIGLCVILSLSSGALLAMVLQIGMILWYLTFRGTGRPWLLLLIFTALAYVTVDILSTRSPLRVFMSYATFSAHNAYWRGIIFEWGMKNVWANPVFGIGLNDWVRPWYMYSGSMDNFWLVMAVRYGIPGFLLIAVGYGLVLWRVGRRDFRADPLTEVLRRAWMFTFMGLTFTLCTVHVWTVVYSFTFFLFGAGVWFIFAPAAAPASDADSGPAAPDPAGPARPGPRYTRFPAVQERPR